MTDWSRRSCCGLLILLLGAGPASSLAQLRAEAEPALSPPQPLTQPGPPQPVNAAGRPVEAWVVVRYAVRADGSTADARAIAWMPPSIDPAPAVASIGGWRFEPGTRDGTAIDWHNNESVVVSRLPDEPAQDTAAFDAAYAAIVAMLDAQPLGNTQARAASERLLATEATRLPAIGLALVQSALIDIGLEDLHSAFAKIRMATDPRVPTLSGIELFPSLQLRLQIETQLGRAGDMRRTHARLLAGLGADNADPAFISFGEALDRRIANEEFLESRARIDGDGWRIDPVRRTFYIDRIDGAVRSIRVECDTRRIERPFDPTDNYVLPEALGACTVFVRGDPGTHFSFVEVLQRGE